MQPLSLDAEPLSPDETYSRRDYIRKLGKPGNIQAIRTLNEAFEEHWKTRIDPESDSFLDAEILLALAEIGQTNTIAIIREFVRRTYQDGLDRRLIHDTRYNATMETGMRLLGLSGDRESMALLENIEGNSASGETLREVAFVWMLRNEMVGKDKSIEWQVEWLCNQYAKEAADDDIPSHKAEAIDHAIYVFGVRALPALEKAERTFVTNGSPRECMVWVKDHLIQNIKFDVKQGVMARPEWGLPHWRSKPIHPIM